MLPFLSHVMFKGMVFNIIKSIVSNLLKYNRFNFKVNIFSLVMPAGQLTTLLLKITLVALTIFRTVGEGRIKPPLCPECVNFAYTEYATIFDAVGSVGSKINSFAFNTCKFWKH